MKSNVKSLIKATQTAHYTNFSRGRVAKNTFTAIHNTGTLAGAQNNLRYFANAPKLKASAHLFVDIDGTIFCSVDPDDTAYAVGTSSGYKHPKARNSNTISIEFVNDGIRPFSVKQIESLAKLMVAIKKDYGIPYNATNYLRHHDITGKNCPAYYVKNKGAYSTMMESAFKMAAKIEGIPTPAVKPKPAQKTVDQMAQEIIAGKHGSGHDNRRKSLGVSVAVYNKVKDRVNAILNGSYKPAPVKAPTVSYYKRYTGKSPSIVTALSAIGVSSTLANRKKIASRNGIKNYSGTAAQNTKLLALLKSGKLKK